VENAIAKITILVLAHPYAKITIFIVGGIVGIFAIFAVDILYGEFGDSLVEFIKLLCKRLGKIKILTIRQRIELVGSSNFLIIDYV
jgi:hypothetical protein